MMSKDDRVTKNPENPEKRKGDQEILEDGGRTVKPPLKRAYGRRSGDVRPRTENVNSWMVSFTDIMALMLTFFVLLFSMTEPAKQDWSEITSAMQSEFNKFYGAVANRGPQDSVNISKINFNQALDVGYLSALLDNLLSQNDNLQDVKITQQRGQLVISLPQDLLFEPGNATVQEKGIRALYALGGALSRVRNKVEISGHADPRPVKNDSFSTNWDLSLSRALNVAGILQKVGYEKPVTVRGHASGFYKDLAPLENIPEEEKRALARRVDIIVMSHDGSRHKPF